MFLNFIICMDNLMLYLLSVNISLSTREAEIYPYLSFCLSVGNAHGRVSYAIFTGKQQYQFTMNLFYRSIRAQYGYRLYKTGINILELHLQLIKTYLVVVLVVILLLFYSEIVEKLPNNISAQFYYV